MSPLRLAVVALAVSLSTLAPAAARACSICGCDPSGGTLGLDRPSEGDLRLGLEARYLSKESGAGDQAESEKEGRTLVRVQYSPRGRLSFSAEAPFYLFRDHFDATGARDVRGRGLGDVQVGARAEVLRLGGLVPRHTLALSAGLKLPTGDNRVLAPADLGIFDEHKQLGTGSTDALAQAFYAYGQFPWVAYAGLQGRLNGSNGRGFRYGHALFATLGARRTLLEARSLFVSLELQARNAGYDRLVAGGTDPDSGGFVGFTTAAAGYQLRDNLLVRATLQVPVATALHGSQHEHPVGILGLAWDVTP